MKSANTEQEILVRLRPVQPEDLPDIARLANDAEIASQLRDQFPHPYTANHAAVFFQWVQQGALGHVWLITVNSEVAGILSLLPQQDIYRHAAEIGYWLGRPFWNKGIMTKAIALVLYQGFVILGFKRIFAGVFSSNPASVRVLIKNGFKTEGIRKDAVLKNNLFRDEQMLALLKCDYEAHS